MAETETETETETENDNSRADVDDENEELWAPPEDCTDEELALGRPITPGRREELRLASLRRRGRRRPLRDDPLPPEPLVVVPSTLGAALRAARGHARLNQRELAAAAGVPPSSVSRAEATAAGDIRLSTLTRLLHACDVRLAVVDSEGTQLASPYDREQFRDAAARRLPAHLDASSPTEDHRAYRAAGRGANDPVSRPERVTRGRPRAAVRRPTRAASNPEQSGEGPEPAED